MQSLRCLRRLPNPAFSQPLRAFATSAPQCQNSNSAILNLLDTLENPPPVPQAPARSPTRTPVHASTQLKSQNNTRTVKETMSELNTNATKEDLKRQMPRRWQTGDIYAPHDLGSVEASKWKVIQRRPEKDVFDMLATNPIKHYKNLKLMSEFVTDTGRIKGSRDTGLRPRNQRRMAKAVRRAIGIGLMPSVYLHPEIQAVKLGIQNYREGTSNMFSR